MKATLEDLATAKECLRIATSAHVNDNMKKVGVAKLLKRQPGCARFQETKAAVWLLT